MFGRSPPSMRSKLIEDASDRASHQVRLELAVEGQSGWGRASKSELDFGRFWKQRRSRDGRATPLYLQRNQICKLLLRKICKIPRSSIGSAIPMVLRSILRSRWRLRRQEARVMDRRLEEQSLGTQWAGHHPLSSMLSPMMLIVLRVPRLRQ